MNALNDGPFEATGRQQIGQRAAVSEWIDRESRGRRVIQIIFKPLMSLNQLIDHSINVNVRFIRHYPAAGGYFEPSRLDEMLQGSLFGWVRLIPPQLQNTNFGPNKCHVFVLLHS